VSLDFDLRITEVKRVNALVKESEETIPNEGFGSHENLIPSNMPKGTRDFISPSKNFC